MEIGEVDDFSFNNGHFTAAQAEMSTRSEDGALFYVLDYWATDGIMS